MSFPLINRCPGTLAKGYRTYSQNCLNRVFDKKKVSHILPFDSPSVNEEVLEKFHENQKQISISGVQEKLSMLLDKNKLRLIRRGEQGTYILKPIPRYLKNAIQIPANENLTMQIARQVYGIRTAENALMFFSNGDPAYITKRFDVDRDGRKLSTEDFASLAGKTMVKEGPYFKYLYSYEEIGELIRRYVASHIIEMERYFQIIIFNYLISNGDAHLKNFSLIETSQGDYRLSPAYDLINTRIHILDSDFALHNGLFKDDFKSNHLKTDGHIGLDDFREFGRRLGLKKHRMEKILQSIGPKKKSAISLIQHSYLNSQTKEHYLNGFLSRCKQMT